MGKLFRVLIVQIARTGDPARHWRGGGGGGGGG